MRTTRLASAQPSTPALERDLDRPRGASRFPPPCWTHLLSRIRNSRFLHDRDGRERQRWGSARCRSIVGDQAFRQRLATPPEQLARIDAALASNLRHRIARLAGFRDQLKLLLVAPAPPTLTPRDDLEPPAHRPSA